MKHISLKESDISDYLKIVCRLIDEGKRTLEITKNHDVREKNKSFIRKYKLKDNDIDCIIKSLTIKDFCYAVDEENKYFSDERLFIFCKQKELDYFGSIENVDIYIKLKKQKLEDNAEVVLYISFHKREKDITYLFRDKS